MFQLGTQSKNNLVGVLPSLKSTVELAITMCEQDFTVFEGLRTKERQQKLVAAGASKTMNSKHIKQADGFGHAVDLVPWINGQARWEWGPIYWIALAMRAAAVRLGTVELYWGGVWDKPLISLPGDTVGIQRAVAQYCARHPGPDFIDGPHFQIGR